MCPRSPVGGTGLHRLVPNCNEPARAFQRALDWEKRVSVFTSGHATCAREYYRVVYAFFPPLVFLGPTVVAVSINALVIFILVRGSSPPQSRVNSQNSKQICGPALLAYAKAVRAPL